jgi:hypothetical protein
MAGKIRFHYELQVYKESFAAAMDIFDWSGAFPPEERYSLTDQIRRSSRSVCANLSEAWRKRRYDAILGRLVRMINDPSPWLLTKSGKSDRK